ncbi:inositol monophosphatase [Candidatus Dojkabacteria bacterium]|nr:inositol monophosphatase [Candidatus Dojkabacteria bacterium]
MNDYQAILEFSKVLALKAGEIMLTNFKQDMDFENKSDNTPVTIADTSINKLIIEEIKKSYPNHSVLGEEESDKTDLNSCSSKETLWICDPIDGTFPYSMGMPISTFMLAFLENGIPKVAVIYDPYRKLMFSAIEGMGTYRNDKKISVNSNTTFERQKIVVDADNPELYKNIVASKNILLSYLSFGYGAIAVASGQVSVAIYYYDKPWDGAAPSLIVKEAGGKVTDLNGNDQKYNNTINGIVCSNEFFHDQIIQIIKESR